MVRTRCRERRNDGQRASTILENNPYPTAQAYKHPLLRERLQVRVLSGPLFRSLTFHGPVAQSVERSVFALLRLVRVFSKITALARGPFGRGASTVTTHEQDLRLGILNTLLTTPHRDLAKIWPVHSELIARDPRFYVRLAAWYADQGDVRDHKEMFIISLVLSDFAGHRDVGLALLRRLPPYEVARVVDFISGRKRTRKLGKGEQATARNQASRHCRQSALRRLVGAAAQEQPAPGTIAEEFGLFRNVPRSVRTEISRYLREREADPDWFDSSVLVARKALKRLYALLHIKPSERAQSILFAETPPPDSRLFALRQLATATSPAAQARAIVEHRIPYRIAATVVTQMTPAVLVALIEQMSAQELINNLGSLQRRGALDVAEIKELVAAKLEQARTAKRVSAFKAEQAADAVDVPPDLRSRLEDVADAQVKAKGRITRPTALLIDKSSSMEQAIELGKRIGAMISAICDRELFAYAFDTMAYEIRTSGDALADWEQALAGITAGGCTSCGVALKYLAKKKQYVEQIILVTDEQENSPPPFVPSFKEYRETLRTDPSICIVRTPGGSDQLESACRREGLRVDVFHFTGDYYSLPNLIPLLSRPSILELLMEIMDYPLPERQAGAS